MALIGERMTLLLAESTGALYEIDLLVLVAVSS